MFLAFSLFLSINGVFSSSVYKTFGAKDYMDDLAKVYLSKSLPYCSTVAPVTTDPQSSSTTQFTWNCPLTFESPSNFNDICFQSLAQQLNNIYGKCGQQNLCLIKPDSDRMLLTEQALATELTSDENMANNNCGLAPPLEQVILEAPCSSKISDIVVLVGLGQLVMAEAAQGCHVDIQVMQRLSQLNALIQSKHLECLSKRTIGSAQAAAQLAPPPEPVTYGLVDTMIQAQAAAKSMQLPPPSNMQDAWSILFTQRKALQARQPSFALTKYPVGEEPAILKQESPPTSQDSLDANVLAGMPPASSY